MNEKPILSVAQAGKATGAAAVALNLAKPALPLSFLDWRPIGTMTLDHNAAAALMANGILSRVPARETLAALIPILDAAKGRPTPEMLRAAAAMILPWPSPETIRRAKALLPAVTATSQTKPRVIAAPWPGFRTGEDA